ncbi:hypothetical protein ACLOJK_004185 [Asimina triloba]
MTVAAGPYRRSYQSASSVHVIVTMLVEAHSGVIVIAPLTMSPYTKYLRVRHAVVGCPTYHVILWPCDRHHVG